jgi:hypothetical protein
MANADVLKLNELTVSECSELTTTMVDETAFGVLQRTGSRGITIVSLQRKSIFVN